MREAAALVADPRVSIVVLTFNRVRELDGTLLRLSALPGRPHLIVVDNGSSDGTAGHMRAAFPAVELVRCEINRGAAARNEGVARVRTPYVAFCDDDTWWEPGALARAADVLDAHPKVALISGRVLVGPSDELDPACARMAESPLDSTGLPGPALIAFMAAAVVMRTDAFRAVGGYEPRFFLGAEEALVAMDLLALGWRMVYRADVVTHHHPSPARAARAAGDAHAQPRLVGMAAAVAPQRLARDAGGAARCRPRRAAVAGAAGGARRPAVGPRPPPGAAAARAGDARAGVRRPAPTRRRVDAAAARRAAGTMTHCGPAPAPPS